MVQVEALERYNKSFGDAPKALVKLMRTEFLRKLRTRFGYFGVLRFFVSVARQRRRLMKTYSNEYDELVSTVPNPKLIGEFVFLSPLSTTRS